MMYQVVKFFTDLHDNDYPYSVGDTFPRSGVKVTDERLAELAGSNNKQGQPLIQLVKPEKAQAGKKTPAKRSARKTAEK